MKSLVPFEILDKIVSKTKSEFQILCNGELTQENYRIGQNQWSEIRSFIQKECLKNGYRLGRYSSFAWVVLRNHFKWFGWVPSVKAICILYSLKHRGER